MSEVINGNHVLWTICYLNYFDANKRILPSIIEVLQVIFSKAKLVLYYYLYCSDIFWLDFRRSLGSGFPPNLVPRVLWLFGQRVGASRDSGVLEFSFRKISAVKQWKSMQGSQSKNLDFFEFSSVSAGAHPLTKKPEDSGYEIAFLPEKNERGLISRTAAGNRAYDIL